MLIPCTLILVYSKQPSLFPSSSLPIHFHSERLSYPLCTKDCFLIPVELTLNIFEDAYSTHERSSLMMGRAYKSNCRQPSSQVKQKCFTWLEFPLMERETKCPSFRGIQSCNLLIMGTCSTTAIQTLSRNTNQSCNAKGAHSTMNSVLALHPATPSSILGVPKNFSRDVAELH